MTLEQQVCSLELAKRLKELGAEQESLFVWIQKRPENAEEEEHWYIKKDGDWAVGMKIYNSVSAFTVAELLEMSPASTSMLKRTDKETNTIPRYYVETFEHYRESDWNENPANALAKMFIYLLENKLTSN